MGDDNPSPAYHAILVALQRLRQCPEELCDECWPPDKARGRQRKTKTQQDILEASDFGTPADATEHVPPKKSGKWAGRLRGRGAESAEDA